LISYRHYEGGGCRGASPEALSLEHFDLAAPHVQNRDGRNDWKACQALVHSTPAHFAPTTPTNTPQA
jgi:hypothetical protein